jgi:hypothetical protein
VRARRGTGIIFEPVKVPIALEAAFDMVKAACAVSDLCHSHCIPPVLVQMWAAESSGFGARGPFAMGPRPWRYVTAR